MTISGRALILSPPRTMSTACVVVKKLRTITSEAARSDAKSSQEAMSRNLTLMAEGNSGAHASKHDRYRTYGPRISSVGAKGLLSSAAKTCDITPTELELCAQSIPLTGSVPWRSA